MTERDHKKLLKRLKRIPMKSKVYKNKVLIYYKICNNIEYVLSYYDLSELFPVSPAQELSDFIRRIFGGDGEL